MSRKNARENAYKLIFEYTFSKEFNRRTFGIFRELDDGDPEYLEAAYRGVIEHYDELTGYIAKYSRGFALDRIYRADLSAMLLAAFEMKYMDDIPVAVSINEALNLCNRYSDVKSRSFVNGILSSINKELNP